MVPAVDDKDVVSPRPGLRISDFTAVAVSLIQWDIPSVLIVLPTDDNVDAAEAWATVLLPSNGWCVDKFIPELPDSRAFKPLPRWALEDVVALYKILLFGAL